MDHVLVPKNCAGLGGIAIRYEYDVAYWLTVIKCLFKQGAQVAVKCPRMMRVYGRLNDLDMHGGRKISRAQQLKSGSDKTIICRILTSYQSQAMVGDRACTLFLMNIIR